MTMFGKILVFLNLALSLFMAAWALGLYTNRVDWSNSAAKEGKPEGVLAERKKKADEYWYKMSPAEARRKAAVVDLGKLEQRRPGDQRFYKKELTHLQSGAKEGEPARAVGYRAGRMLLVAEGPDKVERPQMIAFKDRAGRSLKSVDAYNKDFNADFASILQAMDAYLKAVDEDTRLSREVVGVPGRSKGLRQRLWDEEAKTLRVIDEQGILEPILVNASVESQLLLKRHKSLRDRLEELGGAPTGVAAGGP